MDALSVDHVAMRPGRMTVRVRLAPRTPRETTPELAARLLRAKPTLARHACINGLGPTFAAVIAHTSVPHVLEHLIIDAQVHDGRTLTDAMFVGTTEWLDAARTCARVEVNFTDDLVALRALNEALAFLNNELARGEVASTI